MSKTKCLSCGEEFFPRQYNQRFCSKQCNDAHYTAERRRAMELLRSQTYFGRELVAAAETKNGPEMVGAVALRDPLPAPGWSVDPVGTEAPLGIDVNEVPEAARQ